MRIYTFEFNQFELATIMFLVATVVTTMTIIYPSDSKDSIGVAVIYFIITMFCLGAAFKFPSSRKAIRIEEWRFLK